jgi:hypothetical protein
VKWFVVLSLAWMPVIAVAQTWVVAASSPILNTNSVLLPGTSPASTNFSCTYTPGCLVQLLQVGSNSLAHFPDPVTGAPSGGDTVLTNMSIGQGIFPLEDDLVTCRPPTGRFDTAGPSTLQQGMLVYVRAWNNTNLAASTHWGQSGTFLITNTVQVFDVSYTGLKMTTVPKSATTNTLSPKGLTYLQELIAGTNPNDPDDVFAVNAIVHSSGQPFQTTFFERAGRVYTLQRATNELTSAVWTNLVSTGPSTNDNWLTLTDNSPPNAVKTFYRVRVRLPGL